MLCQYQYDIKKSWIMLNEVLGRKSFIEHATPNTIIFQNEIITDKIKIAETSFLVNISSEIHQRLLNANNNLPEMLQPFQTISFLYPVQPYDIIEISQLFIIKLGAGYDNISTKLSKETIDLVAMHLTHIFNLTIDRGIFPDEIKLAKVILVYKAGDQQLVNNYMPISLLPALSQLFENNDRKTLLFSKM